MMQRSILALSMALLLSQCTLNPRRLPEPLVPASSYCAESLEDIQEAVFRHMFDSDNLTLKRDVSFFFLALKDNADPSPKFMARFKGHVPVVIPISKAIFTDLSEPRLPKSDLRGVVLSVTMVRCEDDSTATVEGGEHSGNLGASGHSFTVKRIEHRWLVAQDTTRW